MNLLFTLVKARLRINWSDTTILSIVSTLFVILNILFVTFTLGFFLIYQTDRTDDISIIAHNILYFGRFVAIVNVGITYFIPFFTPVSRKIHPIYPVKRFHAFSLNYLMDVIFNGYFWIYLLLLASIFPINGLTFFKEFIALMFVGLNTILAIRLLQNSLFSRKGNLINLGALLLYIGYLTYTSLIFSQWNEYTYLLDICVFPLLYLMTYYADLQIEINLKVMSKSFINKSFWLSLLFNNPKARRNLVILLLFPYLLLVLYLSQRYLDYQVFPDIYTIPAFLWMVLPIFLFGQISNNFWSNFSSLFHNIDSADGRLTPLYSAHAKATLTLAGLHSISLIFFSLLLGYNFYELFTYYLIVTLNAMPIGMYYSLNRSKKVLKGIQQGRNMHSRIGIFLLILHGVVFAQLHYYPEYFYYNYLLLGIGIVYHFMLKEDYQRNKYRIYSQAR